MTTIHTVPKTLYIHTHGCQMNVYDSDKIAAVLYQSHHLQRVDSEVGADVLLLNTCSIREKAQEKVFSQLGVWKALRHRDGARPIIGVGGCVASQEGEAIRKRAPYVDLIFGPQTLHRLPVMLDTVLRERRHAVDVSFPQIEKFDNLPAPRADGPSAYVSIQEGCSKYCSFCVVPYTRGEEVSRPLDQVLSEIKALADQNVKEITLLGQNVNAWRGIISDSSRDTADLALLIECIADIAGIERIRFLTSHPLEFDDRLIDVYISTPKLVSHLHLPVQHGSDRILAAMKRGHTVDTYLHIIERLRAVRPDISISSDFIVGFPGETDQDFDQTMQLIDLVRFDKSFSFLYSPRPGTPATMLVDKTPIEVKKRRLQQLQQKLDGYVKQYSEQMVGTIQRVLVERHAHTGNELLAGRCENMRIVNFIGNSMLIGHYVDVRITMAMPNSLQGELL